jgi:hypothetical protein
VLRNGLFARLFGKTSFSRRRAVRGRWVKLGVERLEDRVVPSTDTWTSAAGGSWNTPGNWSNGVPQAGDSVVINQPGNITVTLNGSTTVSSLSLTGDTLNITGGTLTLNADSSLNSGSTLLLGGGSLAVGSGASLTSGGAITVQPGSQLSVAGAFTQNSGASLTLAAGSLGTGVGTNLLGNAGFESPSVSNATTPPGGWTSWGTSYLNTQYAHTGAQSLEEYGPNSGVLGSFSVTPGVSYTGSVYAMTPANNPLTGPEGAFLQIAFHDSNGNQISSDWVTLLTSASSPGGPISGSVGNQGWNTFSTTAVAPGNAATAVFTLQVGPYTGQPGTAGGAAYFDDAQFGPTAVNGAQVSAGSLSNSGTITLGAGGTVTSAGTFTQTGSGTLSVQLGGPPAGGFYGSLSAAGSATLGGTLQASVVNGYAPSVGDGFNVIRYASATGTFASFQLPSGSGYAFAPAVNPTYVGLGALPAQLSTTVNAGSAVGPVWTNMLGVNLTWWDDQLTTGQTQQMVQAAGLDAFRFPGGSSSDDYHFTVAANFGDPVADNIPQFVRMIEALGGVGLITLDYGSGSPQEAAAELAYLEGSPTDATVIGNGLEWNDGTNQWQQVNWQTVGYWASLRAAGPLGTDDGYNFLRINHPSPFSGIRYWEVGNEEYGGWETDHHGTPGPGGVGTGAAHDPATYAAFANTFAGYAAEIDPGIVIGIDSGDPTGAGDNNWTRNVLTQGKAIGFVPGFISDHSYMQGPGSESDSYLLYDTVSDANSVLDWSTRYADYQGLLQATLGGQASGVAVMATEFNSVYSNPGKQTTSLVNGLFIADSIGSLLDSGYTGGFVWDLRNGWDTSNNNSPSLYGWRQGGDYGLLGGYVPYPNYFAEQLASKIVQAGGQVVSAGSNYAGLAVYAAYEANGHLDLLVVNKNPDAAITEPITVQGFTPGSQAQVWQYGEAQDFAQSQSSSGSSALANFTATLTVNGSTFSYTFPSYSMTVLDLAPAGPLPTTTTVSSSVNPSSYGQFVTFTATVTAASDGATPTGTVTFLDGGTALGTGTLDAAGHATFTTAALAVGTHSITASYGGDANSAPSTSAALPQTVNQSATSTTVASSQNPSAPGQAVTFTATVTPTGGGAGVPTGSVTFSNGATALATVPLGPGGTVIYTTSSLAVGSHSITAAYGGDANFGGSTSPALIQTVGQFATTTTLTAYPNPAAQGRFVTFTATVSGSGPGTPTGSVTFKDGSTVLGSAPLVNGVATFSTNQLKQGFHPITAVYSGDSVFLGSTSNTVVEQINRGGTPAGADGPGAAAALGPWVFDPASPTGLAPAVTPTPAGPAPPPPPAPNAEERGLSAGAWPAGDRWTVLVSPGRASGGGAVSSSIDAAPWAVDSPGGNL